MDLLRRAWAIIEHDIPWAVSAFLFAQLINPLRASVERLPQQLTLRRMVYLAAFVIFAWAAAEWYFSAEVALVLAGDSALYIEIMAFAYVAVVRTRIDRVLGPAMHRLRLGLCHAASATIRATARVKRSIRLPRLFDDTDSGDVPDGPFAFS
jgi:hypothetical protein